MTEHSVKEPEDGSGFGVLIVLAALLILVALWLSGSIDDGGAQAHNTCVKTCEAGGGTAIVCTRLCIEAMGGK